MDEKYDNSHNDNGSPRKLVRVLVDGQIQRIPVNDQIVRPGIDSQVLTIHTVPDVEATVFNAPSFAAPDNPDVDTRLRYRILQGGNRPRVINAPRFAAPQLNQFGNAFKTACDKRDSMVLRSADDYHSNVLRIPSLHNRMHNGFFVNDRICRDFALGNPTAMVEDWLNQPKIPEYTQYAPIFADFCVDFKGDKFVWCSSSVRAFRLVNELQDVDHLCLRIQPAFGSFVRSTRGWRWIANENSDLFQYVTSTLNHPLPHIVNIGSVDVQFNRNVATYPSMHYAFGAENVYNVD
eukprot:395192_1